MSRKIDRLAENLLEEWAFRKWQEIVPDRALGFPSMTAESKAREGFLSSGKPGAKVPRIRLNPDYEPLAAIEAASDIFPDLIYWLYAHPQIVGCSDPMAAYCAFAGIGKTTGYDRRRRLLDVVIMRVPSLVPDRVGLRG